MPNLSVIHSSVLRSDEFSMLLALHLQVLASVCEVSLSSLAESYVKMTAVIYCFLAVLISISGRKVDGVIHLTVVITYCYIY